MYSPKLENVLLTSGEEAFPERNFTSPKKATLFELTCEFAKIGNFMRINFCEFRPKT